MIVGPDDAAWVTEGGQNAIARVDPETTPSSFSHCPRSSPTRRSPIRASTGFYLALCVQVRDLRFKKYIAGTTLLRRVSNPNPSQRAVAKNILLVHSRDQSVGGLRRCAAPHGQPMRELLQMPGAISHRHLAVSHTELVL